MTMLRSILVALGAAACLLAFAALGEMPGGPVARAMAAVGLGIGVTALVYGEAAFAAVTLGAVSPLAFAALVRISDGAAATAMCLLWLAPRFVLADTRRKLALLVAVSSMAALVAGMIFAAYWEAPMAAHAASCVFAGSCISLVGTVVPVATTTAYALRTAASAIDGPVGAVLVRAAEAHESSRWQPRGHVARRNWRTLVTLSDERAALGRATSTDAPGERRAIEERIEVIAEALAPASGPTPVAPRATVAESATMIDCKGAPGSELRDDAAEHVDIRIDEPSIDVNEAESTPPTGA